MAKMRGRAADIAFVNMNSYIILGIFDDGVQVTEYDYMAFPLNFKWYITAYCVSWMCRLAVSTILWIDYIRYREPLHGERLHLKILKSHRNVNNTYFRIRSDTQVKIINRLIKKNRVDMSGFHEDLQPDNIIGFDFSPEPKLQLVNLKYRQFISFKKFLKCLEHCKKVDKK